jgi:hypothetical protein
MLFQKDFKIQTKITENNLFSNLKCLAMGKEDENYLVATAQLCVSQSLKVTFLDDANG